MLRLTRLAKAASAVILLSALGAGIYGMGRSLWLDEAWVANSVEEPSLAAMFFRTDWLQVNPPLFLLLVRNTVRVVGLSNSSLRSVPLALGMLGAACMLLAARRVLSPAWAVLACAALALHPTAIEYSHTLKQYSGELAGRSGVVARDNPLPTDSPHVRSLLVWWQRRSLTLPLAYPMVFLLPGVALAVYFT